MCGVIGIVNDERAIDKIYPGLLVLQHRGQDAAGAVTFDGGFHLKKGNGLVFGVFNAKNIERLEGRTGIGHVRYPTVGTGSAEDVQPFISTAPYGIALCHNGNLVNYSDLKRTLIEDELRYFNSNCDAELILNVLSAELGRMNLKTLTPDKLFKALGKVYERLVGSYAVVSVLANKGFLAFRDPNGIKPLVMGRNGQGYCFASESVALDLLGYHDMTDVLPGQAVFIDRENNCHVRQIKQGKKAVCIFEYVYFARPDSVIDGVGVYEARLRLGEELGKECLKQGLEPDVVMPVPDTARGAALMVAETLGVKHREGLIKNRYIYRTFIMPTQTQRIEAVRLKLNPIRSEIEGKDVLLIDDSIVRGTTSREIVALVRSVGARKVFYALFSPPLRFPCVYGIDMQTRGELIARDRSVDQIRKSINADALVYQTVNGLVRGVGQGAAGFCTACFTGAYPTLIPEPLLERIEAERKSAQASQG
ncbi:amidophosphoribosyltransferase [candidate division WOR-3 bacterium]|nr:amidophosphoribosyltransferase [candidate division WOR-3 bacterium]